MAEDTQLPARYDIEIVQGDDYLLDVEVQEDGSTVDFTGHSDGILQVRKRANGPLLDEYLSSGTLTMGAGGRVQVRFSTTDTRSWPKIVRYAFQTDNEAGDTQTYFEGKITTEREVAE